MSKRGPDKKTRRFWSENDLRWLAALYPHYPSWFVARLLGRTVFSTYGAAQKRALNKSPEFLASDPSCRLRKGSRIGEAFQFRKGQTPANKGLRRPGYSAGRGRMQQTQFTKGHRPRNWQPPGSVRTNPDGYLEIKVREGRWNAREGQAWQLLHRELWKREHGPIPRTHIVVFKDRDRKNCAIENLELISKAENARRNRMWNVVPRPLAEAIQLAGVLKRKLRSLHGKEQDQRSA